MARKTIEFDQQCDSCKGTGIYQGFAEKDGIGVVCKRCDGTGKYHFVHSYDEFEGKKKTTKVKHVLECNPGIGVGLGNGKFTFEDWGGMSYNDWFEGKPFPKGSEMRKYSCPAWYYQCADYERKPNWDQCIACGSFSDCKHFSHKEACWARFDKEDK